MAIVAECVGLDIGQTAIKAVRFRRRLSGREATDYFYRPLPFTKPDDLSPARRAKALRSFLWQHGLYATDRLVTAIPCHDLFVRTLSLPFKDVTKLTQVIPFEMENLVPMPLEELAIGSVILPPARFSNESLNNHKGSEVLVTAAPKDKVAEHLQFLAQADIEPSAINIDALALFSVTQYLRGEYQDVPDNLIIIDIGASKTTVCLIHDRRPVVLRTIFWGGNHLTQALAARQGWTFAEAERQKRTLPVDQMAPWVEPLVRELYITIQAFEGTQRSRLTYCWVSGGGAKLREMASFVAHQLGLSAVGPRQGFGPDSPRAFSIAFGLAIHPKLVRPRWRFTSSSADLALDFKTVCGEDRAKSKVSQSDMRLAVVGALLIGLLAIADFAIHFVLQHKRVANLKTTLQVRYEQVFGTTVAPGDELDQARYRIAALDKTLAILNSSQHKVLPALSTFVKQLPPGVPVKVRELTVDRGTILLEGETTSFEAVEKIKQAFATSHHFEDVSVSETRVGAAPNQVVFRLTVTVVHL
ncbi:MAG: pilus assembly protein PilM [Nitrospira sp.]